MKSEPILNKTITTYCPTQASFVTKSQNSKTLTYSLLWLVVSSYCSNISVFCTSWICSTDTTKRLSITDLLASPRWQISVVAPLVPPAALRHPILCLACGLTTSLGWPGYDQIKEQRPTLRSSRGGLHTTWKRTGKCSVIGSDKVLALTTC